MKKKIIFASVLAAGAINGAHAQSQICNGTASAGTMPTVGNLGTNYILTGFNPQCSHNVTLVGQDGTGGNYYAVGANSFKGKTNFGGTTNGGGVSSTGTACAIPGGCTAGEATAALTYAVSNAPS